MITEIKFAIMNSLIHSSEEHLSCFDCFDSSMRNKTRTPSILEKWSPLSQSLSGHSPTDQEARGLWVRDWNHFKKLKAEDSRHHIFEGHLKNRKAPGIDNIQAELFKAGIDYATTKVKEIIDIVWRDKKTPRKWRKGLIVKLPKKGNLKGCKHWHGITLLLVVSKVMNGENCD